MKLSGAVGFPIFRFQFVDETNFFEFHLLKDTTHHNVFQISLSIRNLPLFQRNSEVLKNWRNLIVWDHMWNCV